MSFKSKNFRPSTGKGDQNYLSSDVPDEANRKKINSRLSLRTSILPEIEEAEEPQTSNYSTASRFSFNQHPKNIPKVKDIKEDALSREEICFMNCEDSPKEIPIIHFLMKGTPLFAIIDQDEPQWLKDAEKPIKRNNLERSVLKESRNKIIVTDYIHTEIVVDRKFSTQKKKISPLTIKFDKNDFPERPKALLNDCSILEFKPNILDQSPEFSNPQKSAITFTEPKIQQISSTSEFIDLNIMHINENPPIQNTNTQDVLQKYVDDQLINLSKLEPITFELAPLKNYSSFPKFSLDNSKLYEQYQKDLEDFEKKLSKDIIPPEIISEKNQKILLAITQLENKFNEIIICKNSQSKLFLDQTENLQKLSITYLYCSASSIDIDKRWSEPEDYLINEKKCKIYNHIGLKSTDYKSILALCLYIPDNSCEIMISKKFANEHLDKLWQKYSQYIQRLCSNTDEPQKKQIVSSKWIHFLKFTRRFKRLEDTFNVTYCQMADNSIQIKGNIHCFNWEITLNLKKLAEKYNLIDEACTNLNV